LLDDGIESEDDDEDLTNVKQNMRGKKGRRKKQGKVDKEAEPSTEECETFDDWDGESKDFYTESSSSKSEDEERRPRKKSSTIFYPIFNPNMAIVEVQLVQRLKFVQLMSAFDNY